MYSPLRFIGIIGTRRRHNNQVKAKIEHSLVSIYEQGDIIVSGGCPDGGDYFAELIAKNLGIPILIFPPNKREYKIPACYFIRNTYVAQFANKAMIAAVAKDRKGGTEDTLEKHEKFHPKVERIIV